MQIVEMCIFVIVLIALAVFIKIAADSFKKDQSYLKQKEEIEKKYTEVYSLLTGAQKRIDSYQQQISQLKMRSSHQPIHPITVWLVYEDLGDNFFLNVGYFLSESDAKNHKLGLNTGAKNRYKIAKLVEQKN